MSVLTAIKRLMFVSVTHASAVVNSQWNHQRTRCSSLMHRITPFVVQWILRLSSRSAVIQSRFFIYHIMCYISCFQIRTGTLNTSCVWERKYPSQTSQRLPGLYSSRTQYKVQVMSKERDLCVMSCPRLLKWSWVPLHVRTRLTRTVSHCALNVWEVRTMSSSDCPDSVYTYKQLHIRLSLVY